MIKTSPISSLESAFSVKGQNVVISGGNRGIGLGIATAFAQGGADVAILCRNIESGKAAAENCQNTVSEHMRSKRTFPTSQVFKPLLKKYQKYLRRSMF